MTITGNHMTKNIAELPYSGFPHFAYFPGTSSNHKPNAATRITNQTKQLLHAVSRPSRPATRARAALGSTSQCTKSERTETGREKRRYPKEPAVPVVSWKWRRFLKLQVFWIRYIRLLLDGFVCMICIQTHINKYIYNNNIYINI